MQLFRNLIRYIPNARLAFIAAVIVFVVTIIGSFVIGSIYSAAQAQTFIEAIVPSVRTLSFAVITSTSTVIALQMTMLGFAHRLENEFDREFYSRVRLIAMLGAIALTSATLMLLLMSIPITEAENLKVWYQAIYWMIVIGSGWIAALLVSIIIVLYQALIGLIDVFVPEFE